MIQDLASRSSASSPTTFPNRSKRINRLAAMFNSRCRRQCGDAFWCSSATTAPASGRASAGGRYGVQGSLEPDRTLDRGLFGKKG